MQTDNERLRLIPKVDDLIKNKKIMQLSEQCNHRLVVDEIRENLAVIRDLVLSSDGNRDFEINIDIERIVSEIISSIENRNDMSLRKVINATGVILHTNLGRAPLNANIRDKVWNVAEAYSTLEYDIKTGQRGSRYEHVRQLINSITGAEESLVVNNNAAAIILILNTMAKGKDVIVSRGELVEIGDSFRIPEIMEYSGAHLVEVGSTNKTHISDYLKAISEGEIGAILKVHTSNYKVIGFTEDVKLSELVEVGIKFGIPIIHDLGSGSLIDLKKYGIEGEDTVQQSVQTGADIVCFSGDKLLGGPQSGFIVGKAELIKSMKRNPITRAFRIDKLTLAALEATLRLYLYSKDITKDIPTLTMLTMPIEVIIERTQILYDCICSKVNNCSVTLENGYSQVGGGSLPLIELPTQLIKIKPDILTTQMLENKLREKATPVITRIHKDYICIDIRTVPPSDFDTVCSALEDILN